jgi:hypothetical protein
MPIRSYTRSTDCNRVSHGQDILCRIDVPVMVSATWRAVPFPNIQGQPLNDMTTMATALRTGEPLINFDQGAAIPLSLIFQLSHQFAPPSIADGQSQLTVFDHIFHGQRFHGDCLIFTNQPSRQLVQMVFATVGHLLVDFCHLASGLVSISRTLGLSSQRFLGTTQPLSVLGKWLGVGNLLPATQGDQATNPSIQPHRLLSRRQGQIPGVIKPQTDVPLPRGSQANGDGRGSNAVRQRPRPTNRQGFRRLSQEYLAILPPKSRLGELSATAIPLLLEIRIFRSTRREVSEGRLQMPQSLLQRNAAHLIQKLEVILLFPPCQHGRGLGIPHPLLPLIPSLSPFCQRSVVHQTHAAQRPSQQAVLLGSWVKTVAVGFFSSCRLFQSCFTF